MAEFHNIQAPGGEPNEYQEHLAKFHRLNYTTRNLYAGNTDSDGQGAEGGSNAPNKIKRAIGMAIEKKLADQKEKLKANGSCKCTCGTSGLKCEDTTCNLRAIHVECDKNCGKGCCNKKIQKDLLPECIHQGSRMGFKLPIIYTSAAFKASEMIVEITGEIKRGKPTRDQPHCYVLNELNGGHRLYVDSTRIGNECKWLAHSENPNATVIEWIVDKEVRCIVTALHDIEVGAVITVKLAHWANDTRMAYHRLTLEERLAGLRLRWMPPTATRPEGEYRKVMEPVKKNKRSRRR